MDEIEKIIKIRDQQRRESRLRKQGPFIPNAGENSRNIAEINQDIKKSEQDLLRYSESAYTDAARFWAFQDALEKTAVTVSVASLKSHLVDYSLDETLPRRLHMINEVKDEIDANIVVYRKNSQYDAAYTDLMAITGPLGDLYRDRIRLTQPYTSEVNVLWSADLTVYESFAGVKKARNEERLVYEPLKNKK